jgi:hypothetical protein
MDSITQKAVDFKKSLKYVGEAKKQFRMDHATRNLTANEYADRCKNHTHVEKWCLHQGIGPKLDLTVEGMEKRSKEEWENNDGPLQKVSDNGRGIKVFKCKI